MRVLLFLVLPAAVVGQGSGDGNFLETAAAGSICNGIIPINGQDGMAVKRVITNVNVNNVAACGYFEAGERAMFIYKDAANLTGGGFTCRFYTWTDPWTDNMARVMTNAEKENEPFGTLVSRKGNVFEYEGCNNEAGTPYNYDEDQVLCKGIAVACNGTFTSQLTVQNCAARAKEKNTTFFTWRYRNENDNLYSHPIRCTTYERCNADIKEFKTMTLQPEANLVILGTYSPMSSAYGNAEIVLPGVNQSAAEQARTSKRTLAYSCNAFYNNSVPATSKPSSDNFPPPSSDNFPPGAIAGVAAVGGGFAVLFWQWMGSRFYFTTPAQMVEKCLPTSNAASTTSQNLMG